MKHTHPRFLSGVFLAVKSCKKSIGVLLTILGLAGGIHTASAAPELFLLDQNRLSEIQTLVTQSGTPHYEAFQAMKARIDPGDPLGVEGSYANYKRGFYAREAAFLYLITGDGGYADKAYQALWDMYNSTDPVGTRLPDNGTGLNRAQTLSSFAMAYNWGYAGYTQAERDWILSKIEAGLNSYGEALAHANIRSPWVSNWNGVVAGAHVTSLIASGLKDSRLIAYQKSRQIIKDHLNTLGSAGWGQEGEHYLGLSMEYVLPAVLGMKHIGDYSVVGTISDHPLHQLISYTSQMGPNQHSLTWGVGTGYLPPAGTTSALLGLVSEGDLPYYKWFYDHFRGIDSPAPVAEKYDYEQGGAALMMIYYPENVTAQNPSNAYPIVLEENKAGYVVRHQWQDENDVVINLWADASYNGPAWDGVDALHMNIFAYGSKWGSGQGTSTVSASTMSTLHVNGSVAAQNSTGTMVSREETDDGAYVVVGGGSAYSSLNLDSVQRHLLADFSQSGSSVFSTADIISASSSNTYAWNFSLPGLTVTSGTESGVPWYRATDDSTGSWMKVWCLNPGAAVVNETASSRFEVSGSSLDLWVVGQLGDGNTSPSTISLSGSGLAASVTVGGRTLTFDSTAKRISSSGVTGLTARPSISLSTSKTNGLSPLSVDFTADAGGASGLSFAWDFGNGSTATGSTSSQTYSSDGSYQVTLTASDSLGVIARKYVTINAGNREPTAAFTSSNTIVLPGVTVDFNAASSSDPDGDALTYEWSFGDGTTATGQTVSHSWANESKYNVTLHVTDTAGNANAVSKEIRVENQSPVARFTADSLGGVAAYTVNFDASASYDPEGESLTYEWDWKDGSGLQTTSSPTISHTFNSPGSYRVSLKVTDTAGKKGSVLVDTSITILDPSDRINPVTPTTGSYGTGLNYAVYPLDVSGGEVPDFDLAKVSKDGRVGTFDTNVSDQTSFFAIRFTGYIQVDTAGVYAFELNSMDYSYFHIGDRVVIAEAGRFNKEEYGLVYLEAGLHPIEVGYAYDDTGSFGDEISFISVKWKSETESTFREIPSANLYSDYAVFYPTFLVTPAQGPDGTTFTFEATMSSPDGQPLTYLWEFGDGSTSTSRKISHTYNLPSDKVQIPYTVKLTITDSSGAAYKTGQKLLVSKYAWTIGKQTQSRDAQGVLSIKADYRADFPLDRRDSATAGEFVDAVNRAMESSAQISVSSSLSNSFLGDKFISDGVYDSRWISNEWQGWVQYTFENDGVLQPYNVTEYAFTLSYLHWVWPSDPHEWDVYGSTVANPAPFSLEVGAANPDWTLIDSVTDQEYFFYDSDANDPSLPRKDIPSMSYFWTLPNTNAYSHYVFHIRNFGADLDDYIRMGEIQLFDYMDYNVSGNNNPTIQLVTTDTNAESPLTVEFDASGSSDPDNDTLYYAWDFGDGHTIRLAEDNHVVTHTYRDTGNYTAVLTVRDGHGATRTQNVSISVQAPNPNQSPNAAFTASALTIDSGDTITLDASGSSDPDGDAIQYFWQFGDGQSAEGAQVSHTFKKNGLYNLVLKVVDSRGGVGLATALLTVNHPNSGRPIISINFSTDVRDRMASTIGAGVLPVGFWNLHTPDANLIDSYGNDTSAFVAPISSMYQQDGGTPVDRFDGDTIIMRRSQSQVNDYTVTIQSIPYALYDVYVYYAGAQDGMTSSFSANGVTYYLKNADDFAWDGEYNRSTATTPAAAVDGEEYIVFEGISAENFEMNASDRKNSISAIQIVDLGGGPLARDDSERLVVYEPVLLDVLANDIGDGLSIQSVTTPDSGTAAIQNGQILYTPVNGYEGYASFEYTIVDGEGTTSTGTVTIGVGNLPPVATTDNATVVVNTSKTIDVLSNDYDPDTESAVTLLSVGSATNGTTGLSGSSVTYSPDTDYTGSDSFTYTIEDVDGKSSTGTVNINVVLDPNNAPPVAVDDSLLVPAGESVTLIPLINDYDPDDDLLSIETLTSPSVGTVTNNGDGSLTFSSDPGSTGTHSFEYTINDGKGLTATGTFTIEFLGSSSGGSYRYLRTVFLEKDGSLDAEISELQWMQGGSIVDLASSTVTTLGSFPSLANLYDGATSTKGRVATIPSILTFDLGEGTAASPDTFRIMANSGNRSIHHFQVQGSADGENWVQLVDVKTVTNGSWQSYDLWVPSGGGNTAPVANNDSVTTDEDLAVSIAVLSNDTDTDGDLLSISSYTQPSNGSVSQSGSQLVYTPDAGFFGSDAFTYTVTDGDLTDTATVNVTVNEGQETGSPIKINFQPSTSSIPSGFLADTGAVYGDRGNGYSYGWDQANDNTRERSSTEPLERKTLNHMQMGGDRTWEIGLSNGDYTVDIVCGDPSYTNQVNTLIVEGTNVVDPDGEDTFDEYSGIAVTVSDGRLTIVPNGTNAKICNVMITENSTPANTAPVVDAGSDASITLPTDSVSLNGTVSDDGLPGSGVATTWTRTSGPANVSFGNASAVDTTATFTTAGTYVLRLTAVDGELSAYDEVSITVNAAALESPTASFTASSTSGTIPLDVSFDASGSSDSDGTISSYAWDFGDGSTGTGVSPSHSYASVGNYTVTLTVTDNDGLTDQATASITANEQNQSQRGVISVNFGSNTLGAWEVAGAVASANWNNVTSSATVIDDLGNDSGATVTITNGGTLYTTSDSPSTSGDHKMMSSYGGNLSSSAVVTVDVTGLPSNFSGSFDVYAYFGKRNGTGTFTPSFTIGLQVYVIRDTTTSWDGTHDRSTATTAAEAVDGPNYVLFENLTGTSFTLEVRSNGGERRHGISAIQIVPAQAAANTAPVVEAGNGDTIVWPEDSFALDGTVSDDGLPGNGLTTTWTQVSGPAGVIFGSATAVDTTATFPSEGEYVLRLTANDGELSASDEVTVTILSAVDTGVRLTYAAPGEASRFDGGLELSDGTVLVSGGADDLSWLPSGVPVTNLANPQGSLVHASNDVAFILRLSADLGTILRAWQLPAGAAANIQRIRTTSLPDAPTGEIYVSGLQDGGYFIGRLNNNFINGNPTAFDWVLPVTADTDQRNLQAWDVMNDGSVVYQEGATNDNRVWFADANGNAIVMPQLRASHTVSGTRTQGVGIDLPSATDSYIQFPSDVHSWTEADRTTVLPDGNGNKKMGMWPFDIFLTETLDTGDDIRYVADAGRSYGYTGYRYGGSIRIGSITVDRRSNDFYIGFNIQSVFYDRFKNSGAGGEQPDFELAVISYDSSGAQRWWSRLYTEWVDTDGDNIPDYSGDVDTADDETLHSSPDQYVDGLEIDYSDSMVSGGTVVVNARAHGNNASNLWNGNDIAARPSASAFHNRFTGTEGNIHLSWIGKLAVADGELQAATYLGGFFRKGTGNWPTTAYSDPNLDGWPNHNSGWPNLTTTYATANTIRVDAQGRVYVVGVGPRTVTTQTAWQKLPRRLGQDNPVLDEGTSPWASYTRAYAADLSTLAYSTALTGVWTYPGGDTSAEPEGADNTKLTGVVPLGDGQILALGYQVAGADAYTTNGNAIPVNDVPSWGASAPSGQTAILGRFLLPGGTLPIVDEPTTFSSWIADAGVATADRDPYDNPDGDEHANLLEYVLGTNPGASDSSGIFDVTYDASNYTFGFRLSNDAPDASFQIEWTDNLNGTWNTVDGAQIQFISNEGDYSTYEATVPRNSATHIFFRLRAFLDALGDNGVTSNSYENPNIGPDAMDDTGTLDQDTSLSLAVLANDIDDGYPLTPGALSISSYTEPSNGSLFIQNSELVYTSYAGFTGEDTFAYTVSDGELTDTATVTVTVNEVTTGTGAFQQDSGADGIVSIEAENFDVNISRNGQDWIARSDTGTPSGGKFMRAEPDSGSTNNTGYSTTSPELQYEVNFVKTGTHYIWIRGYNTGGTDDSLHVGLGGAEVSTADRISIDNSGSDFGWNNGTMDSAVATINVTSTGVQTLNVWMREDGARFDKIVLTTSSSYTPSGTGPAESSRDGGVVNTPPVAVNDSASTDEDVAVTVSVLSNDTDDNGDSLSIDSFTQPSNGSVTQSGSDLVYTPDTGYFGNDSFTYVVTDGTDIDSGTVTITVNEVTTGTGAFQQDSGADGIVSIEAENFDVNISRNGQDWIARSDTGTPSGGTFMRAEPDSGSTNNTGYSTTSPELQYEVNFVKTGTHYIWIRGYNTGGTDDSLHVGLGGAEVSTADRISIDNSGSDFGWNNGTMDSAVATINVTSTGVQTLNVWMREDGARFDKIVLTTNSSFTPSGTGPAESSRDGGTTPTNNAPVAVNDAASVDEAQSVTLSVLSNDTDADNDALSMTSLTQPSNGTVSQVGNELTYTAPWGFSGNATFAYTVSDGTDTDTGNVTVSVTNLAPAAPTGLAVTGTTSSSVSLDWANNSEGDLAGYNVWRSTTSGSGYVIVGTLVSNSNYTDNSASAETTYYYVVTAEDNASNESGYLDEASATTDSVGTGGNTIDLNAVTFKSYNGTQDEVASTTVTVLNGGSGVQITGNFWKYIDFNYNITANTILEVTVSSADEGEILAIGFDNDDSFTTKLNNAFTQLAIGGSDGAGWGFQSIEADYSGPGPVTLVIQIGQFYTGTVNRLCFIGDDDADDSTDATFENIEVYEAQ